MTFEGCEDPSHIPCGTGMGPKVPAKRNEGHAGAMRKHGTAVKMTREPRELKALPHTFLRWQSPHMCPSGVAGESYSKYGHGRPTNLQVPYYERH